MFGCCTLSADATLFIPVESSANVCPMKFIVTSLQEIKVDGNCHKINRERAGTERPTSPSQGSEERRLPAFDLAPFRSERQVFLRSNEMEKAQLQWQLGLPL